MKYSAVFVFDYVKIKFITYNINSIHYCTKYFDVYSKTTQELKNYDWTIEEIIGPKSIWKVDLSQKKIELISGDNTGKFAMRVLRSLVILEDVIHGRTMFKGSSFVSNNGNGVVLVGPRRSGKTSLLISNLFVKPRLSKFVSNSVFSLEIVDNKLCAFGYPMSMGIRDKVLKSMVNKGSEEVQDLFDFLYKLDNIGNDNRYYVDPPLLRNILNNRVIKSTTIKTIIIVKNIPTGQKSSIRKLSSTESEKYFEEYFTKYYNRKNGSWFNLFNVKIHERKLKIIDFISKCDCYQLTYNIGSHKLAINLMNKI